MLKVLHGKKGGRIYVADCLLTGWIAVIGTAEAAHLTAVFLGRSFSDAVLVFGIGVLCCAVAAVGEFLWRRRADSQRVGGSGHRKSDSRRLRTGGSAFRKAERGGAYPYSTTQIVLFLLFVVLIVCRMRVILDTYDRYLTGDMTAETVESFLRTDSVYQVDPLTGSAYTDGIPLRLKVLCLPTLYGALCRIFGVSVREMVWRVVPVAVLLGSCLAYYLLARSLFPGEADKGSDREIGGGANGRSGRAVTRGSGGGANRSIGRAVTRGSGGEAYAREKRWLFLVLVAFLFLVGDYLYGMDGFGLAYSGFRGETIRNAVLLPYMMSLILRRRWKTAALCVLAEACIVWTLYGMGVCLFVLAGMALVRALSRRPGVLRLGKEAKE